MWASMDDHLVQDNVEINKKEIVDNQFSPILETKTCIINQLPKSNCHSKSSVAKNQWTIARKRHLEKQIVIILASKYSITMTTTLD
jgi:hypothetical protein